MMIGFPRIFRVRQSFRGPSVADVPAEIESQLDSLDLGQKIVAGDTIAITAGSRGITNIDAILKAAVEHLKKLGAEPFLVPAMGSHGGATAQGQLAVLQSLGVTSEKMGCPIRAAMDTVELESAAEGFPIYFDRHAYEADHVLIVNRVKPHTMFVEKFQSGLIKMMLPGLGKRQGAAAYHRAAVDFGFDRVVESVLPKILARCNIVGGLAIVENGRCETAVIEGVRPEDFKTREGKLLALAGEWMARLPFEESHLLVVDEIGKSISGTGMDTNVVGRRFNEHAAIEGEKPRILRIAVRSVIGGNACGIGVAEFCTRRAIEQADLEATRVNSLTSIDAARGMLPLDFPTDSEMLAAALATIGLTEPEDARLLWIRNTKDLEEVACSVAYLDEARRRDDLEVVSEPCEFPFDRNATLPNYVVV